jgi:hypothetical protein
MTNSISWITNISEAREIARQRNQPILVDWADLPSCVGCTSLENVTYPNAQVASYLAEQFISVQLNQNQNLQLFDENKIFWTPTITIHDAAGKEQDRWIGYLPPNEFLPRLKFALAQLAMLSQNWQHATVLFENIVSNHAHSFVGPDSLYYLGVAQWKLARNLDNLRTPWFKLLSEYKDSEAAIKASCLF